MDSTYHVTVLMSVYNGEQFLRAAIDSILAQTYQDFEFVIYDDCSTDDTQMIIQSYNDLRIVYRRNAANKGLTVNLADGVARSKSKYIVRMDADDIASPDRIEKQVEWMEQHPEISIMGTPVTYFREVPGDGGLAAPQPQDDATIKATLFISFTLMHPSIIIRRKDLVSHNINYNPKFRYSQDHALYFDCILASLQFANMSEPLLYMRAHKGSISRHLHAPQQECSMKIRRNFLRATGIDAGCDESEIEVYNAFASGVFPNTITKVHLYERFVKNVYNNPSTSKFFNKEILLKSLAGALYNRVYHASDDKSLKRICLTAYNSTLTKYCKKWPIKQHIKFYIKLLIR